MLIFETFISSDKYWAMNIRLQAINSLDYSENYSCNIM